MTSTHAWRRWLVPGIAFDPQSAPPIDFHIHSTWTDGLSCNAENMEAARQQGLAAIAVTEHVNFQSDWYARFAAEVELLRQNEQVLEVYYGMEVAVTDYRGGLKADKSLMNQAELLVGVVHSYPKDQGGFWRPDELAAEEALRREIAALRGLAAEGEINVIGHPGGTYFRHHGPFPIEALKPVFAIAAERGVAVEVNARYCWDLPGMVRILRETNPRVSCGSDAHHANEVGLCLRRMKEVSMPTPTYIEQAAR